MYGKHPIPKNPSFDGRFIVSKINKRLWIQDVETGEILYTPPDFIKIHSRDLLEDLATRANCAGALNITDIIAFENSAARRR